ncbi:MAG: DUF899 family protein [Rhodospirillaceae bacterium]|nr:DUF899 family protein [Rhodospirillaceae bacterium]
MKTAPAELQHLKFPGESAAYRAARNALLAEEMELRRQIERVAEHRRALPPGGKVPKDYVFEGPEGPVKMSELFTRGRKTLAVYSFMFGPDVDEPCTGCAHFLDGLDGAAEHIDQRADFVVVAKSPLARILEVARDRGWRKLRLLSCAGNTYDRDYFGDSTALTKAMRKQQDFKPGIEWDMPIFNVFRREGRTIRHFWGSELLYVPAEPGQEYRHDDLLDPLWNFLDLTPEGRGDFDPQLKYEAPKPPARRRRRR